MCVCVCVCVYVCGYVVSVRRIVRSRTTCNVLLCVPLWRCYACAHQSSLLSTHPQLRAQSLSLLSPRPMALVEGQR
jgi:hypothetical protein